MKKLIGALALGLSLSAFAGIEEDITARLRQLDPNIPIKAIAQEATGGFHAVTLGSGEMLYVSTDLQYIMSGTLYQVSERGLVNLTEESLKAVRKDALAAVQDEDMVIYPAAGERKARVLVFTDIDCPYCRKLHDEVPTLNEMGIEVAYLAFPRSGPDTPTAKKMEAIWCQTGDERLAEAIWCQTGDERLAAMDRAKTGDENEPQNCDNAVVDQFMLGQQVGVTGTPALIFEDGSLVPGYVPAARLQQMLQL